MLYCLFIKFFVFRAKRETEVAQLRKAQEEENKMHESQIAELSKKHLQAFNEMNDQLEQAKRVRRSERMISGVIFRGGV